MFLEPFDYTDDDGDRITVKQLRHARLAKLGVVQVAVLHEQDTIEVNLTRHAQTQLSAWLHSSALQPVQASIKDFTAKELLDELNTRLP